MSEPNAGGTPQQPRHDPEDSASPPAMAADDPRVIQMLSTEHWSVLSSRSLAYNETFTRAGMFLSFLSMSTVALGLLAQGTGFGRDFRVISAVVLAFDLVIGLSTYLRLVGTGHDDLVALHGMSRIRHGYTEIAPGVQRYFTAPIHDDIESVLQSYPSAWGQRPLGQLLYVLSTTLGMIGLIVSAVGGVLTGVITSLVTSSGPSMLAGGAGGVLLFAILSVATFKWAGAAHAALPAIFPRDEAAE